MVPAKTSIVEAAYLLSYGASFRTAKNGLVAQREGGTLTINADIERQAGIVRVGMSLKKDGWDARVNGDKVENLATALSEFALVCFEPGSHQLISGGSSERRRLLDWILFPRGTIVLRARTGFFDVYSVNAMSFCGKMAPSKS